MNAALQTTAMAMLVVQTSTDHTIVCATEDILGMGRTAQILTSVRSKQITATIMPPVLILKARLPVHATRISLAMELTATLCATLLHAHLQMVIASTILKEPTANVM
jgi:hypothetical protein